MDFTKAKIYTVKNKINQKQYIGSSCQDLENRFQQHKLTATFKKHQHRPLYKDMNTYGAEHFFIELVEEYPCKCRTELLKREGAIIRERKATMELYNKNIAGRTLKEYAEENKEVIKQRLKEYNKINHKHIANLKRIYAKQKVPCLSCGKCLRRDGMPEHIICCKGRDG